MRIDVLPFDFFVELVLSYRGQRVLVRCLIDVVNMVKISVS